MSTSSIVHLNEARTYPGLISFILNHNADCSGALTLYIEGHECRAECNACSQHYKGRQTP